MPKPLPSQEDLRALLAYDPLTGGLTWKHRDPSTFNVGRYPVERIAKRWNSQFAGTAAMTTVSPSGYRYGAIRDEKLYAHRVIWKFAYGSDPDVIDHINGDPGDNRLTNLRSVTHAENGRNVKVPADNSSGRVGVRWNDECGKWRAEIQANGRREYLGSFATFEAAAGARRAAEQRLGFHPNHGRQQEIA